MSSIAVPPSTRFRVGLIGAGYISEFHIRALRRLPHVTIIGITDVNKERAQATAEKFQLPRVFSTVREMVEHGTDAVHVLTPPFTHADLAIESLKLGCHVLVEKPLATSVEDCDRIATAAKSAGKSVCVDHSMLYDHFISQALEKVREGTVGDIVTVDYLCGTAVLPYWGGAWPPQYKDGGYPFRDVGVHALYLMEAFLGDIRDIKAEFSTRGGDPNLLYDEWQALVSCTKGIGHVQLSWNVLPRQHLLIVQGTKGVIRADLSSMTLVVKKNTPLPKAAERAIHGIREGLQVTMQVPLNALKFVRKKILQYHGLQMLVEDFYRSLANGSPVPVPPERARSVIGWVERVARVADEAKSKYLEKFPTTYTAPILVTGATGFLGKHVVNRLLREGERVRILVRREPSPEWMENKNVDVVLGDLGDPEAVERAVAGVRIVYHVGAGMKGGLHDFERGTVVGTKNIIAYMLKHNVQKLVYISSLSVLWSSLSKSKQKITEAWPLEPNPERRGAYSQTKLEAEKIVVDAVNTKGLNAVILRPAKIIGKGTGLLSAETAFKAKQRLIILGSGKSVPPLVHVEDLVDAIQHAAKKDIKPGSIFHIVDSKEMTQNELAEEYRRALLPKGTIFHMPMTIMYSLALGVQILTKLLKRPAPLSIYKLRSATAPMSFDCSAAEQVLSWQPKRGVHVGLQETFSSDTV